MALSLAGGPPARRLQHLTLHAIAPDHHALRYSGYVDLKTTADRATFSRRFLPWTKGNDLAMAQTPGATVSVRLKASARRMFVELEYQSDCDERCAVMAWSMSCHVPALCRCQCRPQAFVGGRPTNLDYAPNRTTFRKGDVFRAEVGLDVGRQVGHHHDVSVVWPWCTAMDFRGLAIEGDASLPIEAHTSPRRLRYVAFGDSITHGWCGSESYPGLLARWNGWDAVNLGLQGLAISGDSREVGRAIGARRGDLVSILIGANNCLMCSTCGRFKIDVAALLRGLREVQPHVPIALVTLVAGYDANTCPMETLRARLRDAAREVADDRVVLIEGLALMPPEGRIEADNPHPGSAGMLELASNLNSELGFGALRVSLVGCDAKGRPRLQVTGLAALGGYEVFTGSANVPVAKRRAWPISHSAGSLAHAHCASRALMLAPSSHVFHGTADSDGRAEVTLEHAECDKSLWQVMDLSSCATSAVGMMTSGNRTARHLLTQQVPQQASTRAALSRR